VRAAAKHKHVHEFLRHVGYFRVTEARPDAGSSSREGLTLDRLLSCIWNMINALSGTSEEGCCTRANQHPRDGRIWDPGCIIAP
jgi:hypothetical protein